jgi:hypothetical protein
MSLKAAARSRTSVGADLLPFFQLLTQALTDVVKKKQHCSFAHEAYEVLLVSELQSFASDVWSLGTVMWEVFSDGAVPLAGMDYLAVTSFV